MSRNRMSLGGGAKFDVIATRNPIVPSITSVAHKTCGNIKNIVGQTKSFKSDFWVYVLEKIAVYLRHDSALFM